MGEQIATVIVADNLPITEAWGRFLALAAEEVEFGTQPPMLVGLDAEGSFWPLAAMDRVPVTAHMLGLIRLARTAMPPINVLACAQGFGIVTEWRDPWGTRTRSATALHPSGGALFATHGEGSETVMVHVSEPTEVLYADLLVAYATATRPWLPSAN